MKKTRPWRTVPKPSGIVGQIFAKKIKQLRFLFGENRKNKINAMYPFAGRHRIVMIEDAKSSGAEWGVGRSNRRTMHVKKK